MFIYFLLVLFFVLSPTYFYYKTSEHILNYTEFLVCFGYILSFNLIFNFVYHSSHLITLITYYKLIIYFERKYLNKTIKKLAMHYTIY